MSDEAKDIEYRTPCRLSDQLKVQFWCALLGFRNLWIIFAVLIALVFISNGASITSILNDPWPLIWPLAGGVIGAFAFVPLWTLARWLMGKTAKEIHATINGEGVKVIGDGFNYEAKWSNVSWVREGDAAYLLKFKGLLVRLPKRGFLFEQEAGFRQLVRNQAQNSANRLR